MTSPRLRINVPGLRAGRLPWDDGHPPVDNAPDHPPDGTPATGVALSRRRFIGLAMGTTAVVPAAAELARAAAAPFRVVRSGERLEVWLDGSPRWVLDPGLLGGRPQIDVQWDGAERLMVALSGARFAGTRWPADLALEAHRRGGGWSTTVRHAWTDRPLEGDFLAWLRGTPLRATGGIRLPGLTLAARDRLRVAGRCNLALAPGGLRLDGPSIATVELDGRPMRSDALTVRVPGLDEASTMARPAAARSLVTVERGEHGWDFRPAPRSSTAFGWDWGPRPWRRCHLELSGDGTAVPNSIIVMESRVVGAPAESPGERRSAAGAATGGSPTGGAMPVGWVRPAGMRDRSDSDARLPVGRLRWARSGGGGAPEERWFGSWRGQTELVVPGLRSVVGHGEGAWFEVDAAGDLHGRLALLRVEAPLAAASVDVGLPVGATIQLGGEPAGRRERPSTAGLLAVPTTRAASTPMAVAPADVQLELPADTSLQIVRPEDLLVLGFRFDNLILQSGPAGRRLIVSDTARPGRIVVILPPQHVADPVTGDSELPDDPPPARLAGPSRLAFEVDPARHPDGIDYALPALLDWTSWDPVSAPETAPQQPREPGALETGIELPYGLVVAPDVQPNSPLQWAHRQSPRLVGGRTELWHTRLTTAGPDGASEQPLRAVWAMAESDGSDPSGGPALGAAQRTSILDAAWIGGAGRAIQSSHLSLSALGATLTARLDDSQGAGAAHWYHRAAVGLDATVTTQRAGMLLPFGHPAVLAEAVTRTIGLDDAGRPRPILRRQTVVVVLRKTVRFDRRDLPFETIQISMDVSPELVMDTPLGTAPVTDALWLRVDRDGTSVDLPVPVTGTDAAGNPSQWVQSMAWISADRATSQGVMSAAAWRAERERRQIDLTGQTVQLAPPEVGSDALDGRFEADRMTLNLRWPSDRPEPSVEDVRVRSTAAATIAADVPWMLVAPGAPASGGGGVGAGTEDPAMTFGVLVDPSYVSFRGTSIGGSVVPELHVTALSASFGVVGGDPVDLPAGSVSAADVLLRKSRLLGVSRLLEVIPETLDLSQVGPPVPRLGTRTSAGQRVDQFTWRPPLRSGGPFRFEASGASLSIDVKRATSWAGAPPWTRSTFSFRAFDVMAEGFEATIARWDALSRHDEARRLDVEVTALRIAPTTSDWAGLAAPWLATMRNVGRFDDRSADVPGFRFACRTALAGYRFGPTRLGVAFVTAGVAAPSDGGPAHLWAVVGDRAAGADVIHGADGGRGTMLVTAGADGVPQLEVALSMSARLLVAGHGTAATRSTVSLTIVQGGAETVVRGGLACDHAFRLGGTTILPGVLHLPIRAADGADHMTATATVVLGVATAETAAVRTGPLAAQLPAAGDPMSGVPRAADLADEEDWRAYVAAFAG